MVAKDKLKALAEEKASLEAAISALVATTPEGDPAIFAKRNSMQFLTSKVAEVDREFEAWRVVDIALSK